MNILLCYRLHQFKEEVVPKNKYKDETEQVLIKEK